MPRWNDGMTKEAFIVCALALPLKSAHQDPALVKFIGHYYQGYDIRIGDAPLFEGWKKTPLISKGQRVYIRLRRNA